MAWTGLEQIDSPSGSLRAELEVDRAGNYRYRLLRRIAAAPEDEGALGDGAWLVEEVSGLYDWRGTCRNDAHRTLRLGDPARTGPD
ncbi:hypothetical protein [Maliponia aquimaris]|uniref:Uncharacterized protein n=1 Tax=Maliponia aquimaris TaxID=1673631 RepID=A0A238K8T4_9RHOB|nr:hypothetical protein [Maliponia aquimaris]SMX39308.1 hypothetical protein MAA8898_01973 [Maliponia aquimaris]